MFYRKISNQKISLSSLIFILLIACSCNNKDIQASNKNKINQSITQDEKIDNNNRLSLIKKRGRLICGVNDHLPGFSYREKNGSYSGLSVDLCKAIAVALFNDPTKVEFRHLASEKRFQAVTSGEVDILSRNTTWTLSRDTAGRLDFPPTNFYDGQGLLVAKNSGIENLDDLKGKSICVPINTTSEANLTLQMRKRNIAYSPITFEDNDKMYVTYQSGICDAATSDRSELVARRSTLTSPGTHKILDEVISKEPLGPVIANGEAEWFDVVKWVSYATIKAEELGITSKNVHQFTHTKNPTIRRFLGMEENLGDNIGLSKDFASRVIQHVGNYGEIYDRNIGKPFNLPRGVNNLVKNGGLIQSPPFR